MTKIHRKCLAQAVAVGIAVSVSAAGYAANPAPQSPTGSGESKPAQLQTVQVTASRITLPGLSFPTPVVPVPRQTLNLNARLNVGASLDDLPSFKATSNAQNGAQNGGNGSYGANLRGLGSARTLVLLDGHRFIGSGNLNLVPSILVKRVQVVTGGASASWGSGAVAGVVNVVLRHNLEGLTVGGAIGISAAHDAKERKFEIGGGHNYAGGKGHLIFGLNYIHRDQVWPDRTARNAAARWLLIPTGHGQSTLLPDCGRNDTAVGGVIDNGVLKGYAFNPDGTLRKANLGPAISGHISCGYNGSNINDWGALLAPIQDYGAIARTRYKFGSGLTFIAQLQNGRQWSNFPLWITGIQGIPVSINNPFLPNHVRQVMMQNGETSFSMGRLNKDLLNGGLPYKISRRGNTQLTLGLKGSVGFWHWDAFASYGKGKDRVDRKGRIITKNWNQAVDVVPDPVTGAPICQVALADPSTDCIPLNLFGHEAPSQAAGNYVTGDKVNMSNSRLGVFSFKVQGTPWQLPAGTVALSAGLDWRYRSLRDSIPAYQENCIFRFSGCATEYGNFNVKEAFGEVFVPLIKNKPGLKDLAMDAAVRLSDYSVSGNIWSWKLGFVNNFGYGFRGRVDLSRDIRAPNINELFAAGATAYYTVVDPVKDVALTTLPGVSGGNTNLKPETAKTWTGGVSWSPPSAPNFSASLDYYNIDIKQIITTIGAQTLLDRCAQGDQALCQFVVRDAQGNLEKILLTFVNLAQYKESGVDIDVSYRHPATLFGANGQVRFRTLATYVRDLTTSNGITELKHVGTLVNGNGGTLGMPRWKAIATLGFASQGFSIRGRARYIAAGWFDRNLSIVNNRVGAYCYFDMATSYKFGPHRRYDVYFHVVNIANKQMPHGLAADFSAFYHAMGRYYTLGFRINMP